MTLSSTNIPTPLLCGPINQQWLDQLNGYILDYFYCILNNQSETIGNANLIDQLISDLPSIICNEISPRFFQQSITSSSGTLSISLPAGGTYIYVLNYNGAQDGITAAGNSWIIETDDNDQSYNGNTSGLAAGGTVFSVNQSSINDPLGSLSVFAFRIDCP